VIFVDMPQRLCDVLRELVRAARDIELVGEFPAGTDLVEALETHAADAVVGTPGIARAVVPASFVRRQRLTILEVDPDGRRAAVTDVCGRQRVVNEISKDEMLAALRSGSATRGAGGA